MQDGVIRLGLMGRAMAGKLLERVFAANFFVRHMLKDPSPASKTAQKLSLLTPCMH